MTDSDLLTESLKAIEQDGWEAFSFSKVAEKVPCSEKTLHHMFCDKYTLIDHFFQSLQEDTFASFSFDDSDSLKDKLLEGIMCRLDTLESHKPLFYVLNRSIFKDPCLGKICFQGQKAFFEKLLNITLQNTSLPL